MNRKLSTWIRLAGLTLLALGLGMGTNTLDPALLSLKVAELAPENRNTALGLIAAAGLLVATLTQPVIGSLSDRTRTPLGKRVPYMIAGTLLAVAFLFVVALAPLECSCWAFWLINSERTPRKLPGRPCSLINCPPHFGGLPPG